MDVNILHKCRMLCGGLSRANPRQLSLIDDQFTLSSGSAVSSRPSRIGLFC